MPDGTTLLIDAGDVNSPPRPSPVLLKTSPRLPHDSLSAGKSIRMYIQKVMPDTKTIDYAIVTHFHGDHFGVVDPRAALSPAGYRLTGIIEVDTYLPIGILFDRGYPSYSHPVSLRRYHYDTATFNNYLKFVAAREKRSIHSVQQLRAGADDQLVMISAEKYENGRAPKTRRSSDGKTSSHRVRLNLAKFSIRNIKVNNLLWTGSGVSTTSILPDNIGAQDYNENPLSIGIRIDYGNFDYFTGGDMTGISGNGLPDWFDVETAVAKVMGEVDALSLNHHGVRDAMNEFFLKTLQPRVLIQQSWSSNHPGEEVLHRMINKHIWPGDRDIFATYVHRETLDTYGSWMKNNYKSLSGHVVIRVLPGGDEYVVYILNDRDANLPVTGSFGPYNSR